MRYDLAKLGTTFATRARGTSIRAEIDVLASQAAVGETIIINFDGVQLVSFSFADEFIGVLLSSRTVGSIEGHAVYLANLNEDVLVPIERSLERRGLTAARIVNSRVLVLNGPAYSDETLTAAHARGEFRTADLASDLHINVPACNNRLKPLLAAGLLSRSERMQPSGGREFVYRVAPIPSVEAPIDSELALVR
jgi:hypothetical protein